MNVNIEHLYRRKETYYFRIKFPAALQKYFDRVEVHKTLKTTELNIAREMCILLLKKFDNLFETVRMEVSKNKLDNSEIRALVSRLLKEIIDGYEEFIATSGEISPEKLKKAINNLEVGINILQDALAHNRLDFIFSRDEAKYLLRFHDYTENDLSKTAREILKMRIGEFQAKLGILKGKGVNPYQVRLRNPAGSTAVPASTTPAP